MKSRTVAIVASLGILLGTQTARSEDSPDNVRQCVNKGLGWLVKNQNPDGHWAANGENYPATMTALAGMALLMEGSTMREGKYSNQIRKAVDWFVERAQPNGMLGNPRNPSESGRYIYGHGYGMLFLSQVYGEEEDEQRRQKLEKILTKAVEFSGKAQTSRGGWGYVSAADSGSGGFDEGSTTITQLQGLRAARNSGIVVPKSVITNAQKYLSDATTERGAVLYSLANGGGNEGGPALVAAAIAGGFSTGEYDSPKVKKWLNYCRTNMNLNNGARFGHDEYTNYYFAQSMYFLGDEGFHRLFPDVKESDRLTWSKYRSTHFDTIIRAQQADGAWNVGNIGPVYTTSINLAILQLENAALPIYQR